MAEKVVGVEFKAGMPKTFKAPTRKTILEKEKKEVQGRIGKDMDILFSNVTVMLWNILVDILEMDDLERKKMFGTPEISKVVRKDLSEILAGMEEYQKLKVEKLIHEVTELKELLMNLDLDEQDKVITHIEDFLTIANKTKRNIFMENGKIL